MHNYRPNPNHPTMWMERKNGDSIACSDGFAATAMLSRVARDAVDVGMKRGRCGDRVAGTLELLRTLWT